MPTIPETDELALPGRLIARTGSVAEAKKAALLAGELGFTTDKYWGAFGDESENPPFWPTSKTIGEFNWEYTPVYKNIKCTTINGKTIVETIKETLTEGDAPVITIINEDIEITVFGPGADYPNFEAAFSFLSQKTISTLGSVTIQLGAGTFALTTKVRFQHPNGNRIFIKGAPLKSELPLNSQYQITGNNNSQRINDKIVNMDLLRRSYATVFECSNGGTFEVLSDLNIMQDVLFVSDGANAPGTTYTSGFVIGNSISTYKNLAVVGFHLYNIYVYSSNVSFLDHVIAMDGSCGIASASYAHVALDFCQGAFLSNRGHGVEVTNGSFVSIPFEEIYSPLRVAGNASHGIFVSQAVYGGKITLTNELNGGYGMNIINRSTADGKNAIIRNNALGSIFVTTLCDVGLMNLTTSGPGYGIMAQQGSFVWVPNAISIQGDIAAYSPALNTSGNRNAYIYP